MLGMGLGDRELFGSSRCARVPVGRGCHQVLRWPSALWASAALSLPFSSGAPERAQAEGLHYGTWCRLLSHLSSFTPGNLCMVTGGANLGRIGVITNRERHPGSFDVVHVKDANGNSFATRLSNIFVIGKVSLHGHKAGGFSPVVGGCWLKQRGIGVFCRQLPSRTVKLQCWRQFWLRSLWFCPLRADRSGKGKHP